MMDGPTSPPHCEATRELLPTLWPVTGRQLFRVLCLSIAGEAGLTGQPLNQGRDMNKDSVIGSVRTVRRVDHDGNVIEVQYEVESVRLVDQSFRKAYYALSGYSISDAARPDDALDPTWEGYPIQERIYI